mmetsp:Transcript_5046/g.32114  ORF Transcript_5046/g.32114 Transcript_5046/m.32114 type:complete len:89 (-) Transcript_5046:5292-5558(-)
MVSPNSLCADQTGAQVDLFGLLVRSNEEDVPYYDVMGGDVCDTGVVGQLATRCNCLFRRQTTYNRMIESRKESQVYVKKSPTPPWETT